LNLLPQPRNLCRCGAYDSTTHNQTPESEKARQY
jgi:hypothetical protein